MATKLTYGNRRLIPRLPLAVKSFARLVAAFKSNLDVTVDWWGC